MFVVVVYDIRNDRTRRHVARVLEAYGRRVQRSVFECDLTRSQGAALKQKLDAVVETLAETDSIRCYSLCAACLRNAHVIGAEALTKEPPYYLV